MIETVLALLGLVTAVLTLSVCLGLILVLASQSRREAENIYLVLFLGTLTIWSLGWVLRALSESVTFGFYMLVSGMGLSSLAMYGFTLNYCKIKAPSAQRLQWAGAAAALVLLVLIWTGHLFTDITPLNIRARGYTITPLGWLALGVVVAYTGLALFYQRRSESKEARRLLLPTGLLLASYALNFFDFLGYVPVDNFLAGIAALILGRMVLYEQLFNPLADANHQMRLINQDLRQAIIELSVERDKVKQLNEELQDASRYKSEFLANMSHELRTPLNSIVGYSELLLQGLYGPLTEKQEDRLEKVHRNGKSLLAVINDILDLSKIEAGRLDMNTTLIDFHEITEDVLSAVEPQAESKELALHVELPDRFPQITADPVRIRQVLMNLLSNAVKFTKEGHVTLQARAITVQDGRSSMLSLPLLGWLSDGNWLVINVTDTGIGIPPEHQAEIFEEFKQVDGSTAREFEGTGLGLAITKKLVEMHRGRIWLKSAVGEGSTFFVALPAEKEGFVPTVEAAPTLTGADRQTVLLVEPDTEAADALAVYLDGEGYDTIRANDTAAGIEMARQRAPDAVMVDIAASGIKSWQLIGEMKNHPETTELPVIVGTVIEGEPLGFALGPTNHISRPVQQETLLEAMTHLGVKPSGLPVMMVDDNPDQRDILETYLTSEGFQVMAASSGSEAKNWLSVFKVSVVLVDLLMSDLSGFEVLAHIRRQKGIQDVPVIVISAKELTAEEEDAFHISIMDIIRQQQTVRHDLVQRVIKAMA